MYVCKDYPWKAILARLTDSIFMHKVRIKTY